MVRSHCEISSLCFHKEKSVKIGIIPQGSNTPRRLQAGDYISYDPERLTLQVSSQQPGRHCALIPTLGDISDDRWIIGKVDEYTLEAIVTFVAMTHGLQAREVEGTIHSVYRLE